jgi:hypothetical protein
MVFLRVTGHRFWRVQFHSGTGFFEHTPRGEKNGTPIFCMAKTFFVKKTRVCALGPIRKRFSHTKNRSPIFSHRVLKKAGSRILKIEKRHSLSMEDNTTDYFGGKYYAIPYSACFTYGKVDSFCALFSTPIDVYSNTIIQSRMQGISISNCFRFAGCLLVTANVAYEVLLLLST